MDITSYIWNYMELYNQILKKKESIFIIEL